MSLPTSPVTGCRPVWPETKTRLPNLVAGDRLGFGLAASGLMLSFLGMSSLLAVRRWWREITMRARRVQPMVKGTLIAAMNIGRAAQDEFHDWYDTEHLPERQRVPGFLFCQRWIGAQDGRVSVATYDLETLSVMKSPAYLAIGGANLSPWSQSVSAPG